MASTTVVYVLAISRVWHITTNNALKSGYFILPGPPSCDDICHHAIFRIDADDVSDGRDGFRCKGCATVSNGSFQLTRSNGVWLT